MPTFVNKPAHGSYTVSTGHAKCPDHLWMFDEGTGTTTADEGKTGGRTLTVQGSANQWTTQDLGGGGAASSAVIKLDNTNAWLTDTNFSVGANKSILMVALVKSDDTTNPGPTGNAVMMCAGESTSSYRAELRQSASVYMETRFEDATTGIANPAVSNTAIDETTPSWHLVAGRFYQDGTTVRFAVSIDGEPWTNHAGTDAGTAAFAFNRIAVGDAATSVAGLEWQNNYIAAAWVYKNSSAPATDWDDTFISSLYNDPWQFLSTTSKKLKLLAHASAASATGVSGVVFAAPTGGAVTGTEIGEFTNKSFEASLESNKAVLKVPVADFGGTSLTTSDTPVALVRTSTKTTGIISCTVIEE